jgi:hypothetical protein
MTGERGQIEEMTNDRWLREPVAWVLIVLVLLLLLLLSVGFV